jgi:uncharacterized protein involved in exopolysaccharide biosynthesis
MAQLLMLFTAGMFIGFLLGVLTASLCVMAKQNG